MEQAHPAHYISTKGNESQGHAMSIICLCMCLELSQTMAHLVTTNFDTCTHFDMTHLTGYFTNGQHTSSMRKQKKLLALCH